MWNLPAPPGFHGLHPHKPLTMYHRNLPHWRQDGATYFVTYRLADSLPQCKVDELKELKRERMARTALTAQESRPTLGSTALPSRVANANPTAQETVLRMVFPMRTLASKNSLE